MKARTKRSCFTIEFGKEEVGFIPPFSAMQHVKEEVSAALTDLCIAVGDE